MYITDNTRYGQAMHHREAHRTGFDPYLLLVALAPLLTGFAIIFAPFGLDQSIHATIGDGLREGLLPYRDVYNVKPPLTTLVHWMAIVLFGHEMHAIRLLDMLLLSASSLLLALMLRRLGRPRLEGYIAPFCLCIFYYTNTYWHTAQTDGWGLYCIILSTYLLSRAWTLPDGASPDRYFMAAGALVAAAFFFKYTVAALGLIFFAPLFDRDVRNGPGLRNLGVFLAGGIAAGVALFTVMALTGMLTPYLEIQLYVLGYTELSGEGGSLIDYGYKVLARAPELFYFILFGSFFWLRDVLLGARSTFYGLVLLSFVGGLISNYAQGKAFAYHGLPLLMSYAMIAAFGITRLAAGLQLMLKSKWIHVVVAVALVIWVASFSYMWKSNQLALKRIADYGGITREFLDYNYRTYKMPYGFNTHDTRDFIAEVKELSEPDDELFVFGFTTDVYWHYGVPPRYRYTYSWPFMTHYYDGRYDDDLRQRLLEKPPENFVVAKHDAASHTTGLPDDSDDTLAKMPWLTAYVENNYTKVIETKRFELWRLKTSP
ncbi:glycosyltransferase family 39 protein [Oceanomicrobium pacificus]|uniref:Glycosyltransferase RgtA/B/C/D-like domain-containing protein n=1 Tax=Oceanomicrobium pacificus TaxID=2692916 RepID=A0A6B0TTK8_9RHOB|nr:glycosyltransferase family 39 protein [Oceanomicrobium pacificus]MXU65135.1 hypothetical protein [Oceanomicrobium pacificus]